MAEKIRSHWWILIILALAQFMIVLDSSIVNVALPAIEKAFHMSQTSLQWIVTAYSALRRLSMAWRQTADCLSLCVQLRGWRQR
jgi:predicted MFS family arabinose efflux permease